VSQAGSLAQSLRRDSLLRQDAGTNPPLLFPANFLPPHAGPHRRPSSDSNQRSRSRGRHLRKGDGSHPKRIPTEARDPQGPGARAGDGPQKREWPHVPVMLGEALQALLPERGGLFVDATVGLGGHAEAILAASERTRILGIDRDADSLALAAERLRPFGDRVELIHSDYRSLPEILAARGAPPVAGILADLGFSSFQLGTAERGFSFQLEGPLDMRMDRATGITAAYLVEQTEEEELARIFFEYGEERRSRRIARAIARERREKPILTTTHLAQVVARAAGGGWHRIHPATRVFQALRIAVNGELQGLPEFIDGSAQALTAGGRLAVITFHSLEDRLMKKRLRWLAFRCSCSKSLPQCACGQPNLLVLLTRKPVRPSEEEVQANPRSRSARLRAAERI
jgi:16S rRNA (cytosine1402-N4)-methyltransferase